MIGFDAKMFFNSKVVIATVDTATRKVLSKFGAFVRNTARKSMKKAPSLTRKPRGKARTDFRRRSSRPGQPPYVRRGQLKRFVLFGYDADRKSVVIGPKALSSRPQAPEALEYGGRTKVVSFVYPRRPVQNPRGPLRPEVLERVRANRKVNDEVLRRRRQDRMKRMIDVDIKPRPYMGPAFERELPKVPQMWRDSVR